MGVTFGVGALRFLLLFFIVIIIDALTAGGATSDWELELICTFRCADLAGGIGILAPLQAGWTEDAGLGARLFLIKLSGQTALLTVPLHR